MSGNDTFSEENLQSLLNSKQGPLLRKKISDLETNQEIIDNETSKYNDNYEIASRHDSLIDICASTFGPESQCALDIGYYFVSSEPLAELKVKNFDAFIYNPKTKTAIFVECKSSISRVGKIVNDLYEAKDQVYQHKSYLEEEIGDEIKSEEFVICVPAEYINRIANEFEKRENNGNIDFDKDGLFLVWQVNNLFEESLQLFTRISREDKYYCQHNDRRLTRLLVDGCATGNSEVLTKFYMSSHPLKRNVQIVTHIAKKCLLSDSTVEFTQKDIDDFCRLESTIVHYAQDDIAPYISNTFIQNNQKLGLIDPVEDKRDFFKLKTKGKTIETLLKNYEKEYKERDIRYNINQMAKKKAYDEITSSQSSLFNF